MKLEGRAYMMNFLGKEQVQIKGKGSERELEE